jgi:5-methylcytosine-specific restriction endonuclease McrA
VKPGNWWRAQNNCVDSTKLLLLGDKAFRNWFNLMCVASSNGGVLPDIKHVAVHLRMTPPRAAAAIAELVAAGLFDKREDGLYEPHEWDEWQFKSDKTGAERVQRYRERRRSMGLNTTSDYSMFYASLVSRDGEACVYCVETTKRLVVDHMTPIIAGGNDDLDNLALACKRCNSGKGGRTPEQARMMIRIVSAEAALARYRSRVTVNSEHQKTENRKISSTVSVERGLAKGNLTLSPAALAGISGRKQ